MKLGNIVFYGFCVSDLHEMRSCLESKVAGWNEESVQNISKHAIICVFCGVCMVISAVSGLGPGKLQPKCALDCDQSSILTSCTEKRKELPLWWFSIYSGQHGVGKWNALWRHKVCWVPFIYVGAPWHGTQSIGKNRAAKPTQTEGFALWHCEMQY